MNFENCVLKDVGYSLTQMGRDLKPIVKEIHNWILQYDIQGE